MSVWINVTLLGEYTLVNAETIDRIWFRKENEMYVLYATQGEVQIPLAESDSERTIRNLLRDLLTNIQRGIGWEDRVVVIENGGTVFRSEFF